MAIVVGFCSGILATPSQAISVVDMRAQLESSAEIIEQTNRFLLGRGDTEGEASVGRGIAIASNHVTFELTPIDQYAARIYESPSLGYLNGTLWWAKLSVNLHIDPTSYAADVAAWSSKTRGGENFAVYAVAPNSASGFAPDVGPSTGGGPGLDPL